MRRPFIAWGSRRGNRWRSSGSARQPPRPCPAAAPSPAAAPQRGRSAAARGPRHPAAVPPGRRPPARQALRQARDRHRRGRAPSPAAATRGSQPAHPARACRGRSRASYVRGHGGGGEPSAPGPAADSPLRHASGRLRVPSGGLLRAGDTSRASSSAASGSSCTARSSRRIAGAAPSRCAWRTTRSSRTPRTRCSTPAASSPCTRVRPASTSAPFRALQKRLVDAHAAAMPEPLPAAGTGAAASAAHRRSAAGRPLPRHRRGAGGRAATAGVRRSPPSRGGTRHSPQPRGPSARTLAQPARRAGARGCVPRSHSPSPARRSGCGRRSARTWRRRIP